MIDRFRPGMVFSEEVTLSSALVESFAQFSGDRNPLHLQAESAREYGFARPVAHGAIQSAIVSRLIGMKVPGPGAVWMNQSMEWMRPAFVGDTIKVEAEIESVSPGAETLSLLLRATNQNNEELMKGTAKVKVATKLAQDTAGEKPKEPRVALVTGGSRGIGAAIVQALAAAGFEVAVACKSNRDAAMQIVNEILTHGGRAQCYVTSLEIDGSAEALVKRVESDFGRLDVIVHAATQPILPISATETKASDLQAYQRLHVEVPLELAQAAASGMTERRFGRLIFLGTSYLFGAPPAKMLAYVSAKQGLVGLMRCLALELGPQQITVNMLSPGMTITDLTADIPQRLKEAEARRVPVRRLAVPEDIAQAAVFLASDSAGYINGQNLPLTGGPV